MTENDALGEEKLPMGFPNKIDTEQFIGGVPRGSVISVLSDPLSSGVLLLDQLCYTEKKTFYFTNNKSKQIIKEDLEIAENYDVNGMEISNNSEIIEIDELDSTLGQVLDYFENKDIESPFNIIINSMSLYTNKSENDGHTLNMVNSLISLVRETDSLCYLYYPNDYSSLSIVDKEIFNKSDGIINIYCESDIDVKHYIEVRKMRKSEDLPEDSIDIDIEDGIFRNSSNQLR